MPLIYMVEDDENIRELVLYALKTSHFECTGFESGADFFKALDHGEMPQLVLLDIMLPDEDGLAILKKMRADSRLAQVPAIMLTAKGSEFDKVKGLDMGADDYVTKPFGVMELLSRINAVLRRSGMQSLPKQDVLCYHNIELDLERRAVRANGQKVELTFKEYELLHYLLLNAEHVLSRNQMMAAVWGYDFEGESRTVDMHIKSLRQKLGEAGAAIKTVRSVGYKIGE